MSCLKTILLFSMMFLTSTAYAFDTVSYPYVGCPPKEALKFVDGRWMTTGLGEFDWGPFIQRRGIDGMQFANVRPTKLREVRFRVSNDDVIRVTGEVKAVTCRYDTEVINNDTNKKLKSYQIIIDEPKRLRVVDAKAAGA